MLRRSLLLSTTSHSLIKIQVLGICSPPLCVELIVYIITIGEIEMAGPHLAGDGLLHSLRFGMHAVFTTLHFLRLWNDRSLVMYRIQNNKNKILSCYSYLKSPADSSAQVEPHSFIVWFYFLRKHIRVAITMRVPCLTAPFGISGV